MKLIDQSCEIWEQESDLASMYDHVARCTRVCYQSEKQTKGESSLEFLKRTIFKSNHFSVLEHGTIYLTIPESEEKIISDYCKNPYSKACTRVLDDVWYITTNLRVIKENGWDEDLLKYISIPTPYHHKRVTVSFITSLSIANRCHSISEENTRYCNYSKDKFGNEITFIKPYWFDIVAPGVRDDYVYSLQNSEMDYMNLIKQGCSPQEAREVLPLSTKTQVVHTAYIEDWEQFFSLRYYGGYCKPHPAAKDLAGKLLDIFRKKGYVKIEPISDEI